MDCAADVTARNGINNAANDLETSVDDSSDADDDDSSDGDEDEDVSSDSMSWDVSDSDTGSDSHMAGVSNSPTMSWCTNLSSRYSILFSLPYSNEYFTLLTAVLAMQRYYTINKVEVVLGMAYEVDRF